MYVISTITGMKEAVDSFKNSSIGFVPTMGYLHEGHLSLIKKARKENDVVVLSIFVNPVQFLPGEDLGKYPRDFNRDENLAENEGVDVIFYPTPEVMYPQGFNSYVEPDELGNFLCGEKRPGHFRGVMTVVLKLFNIVSPDRVYFGQKDIQQARIIEQMIEDFNLTIEMNIEPVFREKDGLAMSSRNVYLSECDRKNAVVISESLNQVHALYSSGEQSTEALRKSILEKLNNTPDLKIDYVEIVDYKTLKPLEKVKGRGVIAVAVYFGKTRLIDNIILE